ncbi:hypothetical protein TrLO_g14469 [Triparma laevis f. longispina]|uniref:START domain-containing protein n=1 Tax=Triparma laevis f. longispina TaxID=1714387 RepID=A0A9W7E9K7_9STRA|nr:hypothetical protein TrLO_g14469 [Triparma laevis f. longispina]
MDTSNALKLQQVGSSTEDIGASPLAVQLNAAPLQQQRHNVDSASMFEEVVSQINTDEALQTKRKFLGASYTSTTKPLDPKDGTVVKGENDCLSKTTNNCSFSIKIHDEPQTFLEALTSNHVNTTMTEKLYQEVIENESSSGAEIIVYWSMMATSSKSCDMILQFLVEKQDDDEIIIRVVSIEEEDLETIITSDPFPNATKKLRLLITNGTILLRPLPFKQTSFTFTAPVDLGEVLKNGTVNRSPSAGFGKTTSAHFGITTFTTGLTGQKGAVKKLGFSDHGLKADKLFYKLANLFYDRFKKEGDIDKRYTQDFINDIPNAPPLTEGERNQIAESMKIVDEFPKAKRISGTANDSVEKFLFRDGEAGEGWGVSVAKIDVPVEELFAHVWLLDTYDKKLENKEAAIREVWKNLDGTRSLQYSKSVSIPGGFKDRLFELWITWEERVETDGRRIFIITISDIVNYHGTRHTTVGGDKMLKGLSKGLNIFKELTNNTCEWMRAQQVDLKISVITSNMADFFAKQELGWANDVQEHFRRNGKEVDRERGVALAEIMRGRRGKPLMDDQVPVFENCKALLGGGAEEVWKALESTCPGVEMSMKYFPPRKWERQIATGKAVGVVDGPAEEVAAWVMDYCSNERMRINFSEGNPARIELREKARENEAIFATVKAMPFVLDNREFVFRQFWKSEEGKVLVAVESINDKVDYGTKLKKTRGFTRGLWQLEDLPVRSEAKQCRVTYVTQLDAGGSIPTWVVDKKIPQALSGVQDAIDEFKEDERIDAADRRDLATFTREHWQDEVYSVEEAALLERTRQKFESMNKERWKQLKSPDVFVTMESVQESGMQVGAAIGKAVAVVDTTLEDCAAWEMARVTRERMRGHWENDNGLGKHVVKLSNHSELFYVAADLRVTSIAPREWLTKVVWKMDAKTMIVVLEDAEDDNYKIGAGKGYVRASSHTLWKYERLPEVNRRGPCCYRP